jgi:hypothetical protein
MECMGNIGIIGRARVGKDTAGAWLVDNRGYRRVAFCDTVKEMALELNPIVDFVGKEVRLSDIVAEMGWERAKDECPEARPFLQRLGHGAREVDPDIWVRPAMKKAAEANESGVPVVVTDVRYPNEAESLRGAGFHLVHIDRQDVPRFNHVSDNSLTAEDADYLIYNSGEVYDLQQEMSAVADLIYNRESRRHYARALS